MKTELEDEFGEALEALRPGATLVVGVSGGLDSMALLELLQGTAKRLVAAHFNHLLRGAESDGDEEFVRKEAERRGLEFRVGRGDVRAEAKGISIEMAARKLRHAFLAEVAREVGGDIVLAHHADDQIELVVMRLRRGVEGPGQAGMREVAPSPADPSVRVLRPLLHIRKDVLKMFAEARGIAFREDSSNAELDAERNQVRHVVIPELRQGLGAKFETQFLHTIAGIRQREESWQEVTKAWVERSFAALPEGMKKDVIVMQLHRAKLPPSNGTILSLLKFPSKPVMIRPGLTVWLDAEGKLQVREEVLPPAPVWVHLGAVLEQRVEFGGGVVEWDFTSTDEKDLKPPGGSMFFDNSKIGEYALLRYPQEGDRVRLSGRSSARPLLDVLGRNKVPKEKRDRVVVATTAKGEIFWVEGLRITEDFKITPETYFYGALKWKWTRKCD